ncbi:hypothetical protein O6H91_Y353500 [Diphasiastrum complanatum]|nr:hypothetical protein O6H91_Y353500 [Diphasiastrum complanatum]
MKDYVSKELLSVAASDKRPEMSTTQDPFARTSPLAISESSATSARSTPLSWEMSVPGRARSKRCRSGSRVWSSSILTSDSQGNMEAHSSVHDMPLFAESFLSFDYSALSADSEFILTEEDSAEIPPANKYLKPCKGRKLGQNGAAPRRCTHCLSQHTPQWRAGPAGPKTLCNACGVRYKSGRLLPEYRPAGSPTFMAHIHSNSHRKVVEMRRQKEQKEIKLPHQDEFEFDSRTDDLFQT